MIFSRNWTRNLAASICGFGIVGCNSPAPAPETKAPTATAPAVNDPKLVGIPTYPGAQNFWDPPKEEILKNDNETGWELVNFYIYQIPKASLEEVVQFYRKRLPSEGWQHKPKAEGEMAQEDFPQAEAKYDGYVKTSGTGTERVEMAVWKPYGETYTEVYIKHFRGSAAP